jgi:hypothetical protein
MAHPSQVPVRTGRYCDLWGRRAACSRGCSDRFSGSRAGELSGPLAVGPAETPIAAPCRRGGRGPDRQTERLTAATRARATRSTSGDEPKWRGPGFRSLVCRVGAEWPPATTTVMNLTGGARHAAPPHGSDAKPVSYVGLNESDTLKWPHLGP